MSSSDPRSLRTRATFRTALTDLVAAGAEVSVVSLCRWSGLNRGTFYLHYSDVGTLTQDVMRHLVQKITVAWREVDTSEPEIFARDSTKLIAEYLRHVAEHRVFYRWVLGPDGNWRTVRALLDEYSAVIASGIDQALEEGGANTPSPLLADLLGGALFGVVARWVESPPEMSPDSVAGWLWRELTVHPVDSIRSLGRPD